MHSWPLMAPSSSFCPLSAPTTGCVPNVALVVAIALACGHHVTNAAKAIVNGDKEAARIAKARLLIAATAAVTLIVLIVARAVGIRPPAPTPTSAPIATVPSASGAARPAVIPIRILVASISTTPPASPALKPPAVPVAAVVVAPPSGPPSPTTPTIIAFDVLPRRPPLPTTTPRFPAPVARPSALRAEVPPAAAAAASDCSPVLLPADLTLLRGLVVLSAADGRMPLLWGRPPLALLRAVITGRGASDGGGERGCGCGCCTAAESASEVAAARLLPGARRAVGGSCCPLPIEGEADRRRPRGVLRAGVTGSSGSRCPWEARRDGGTVAAAAVAARGCLHDVHLAGGPAGKNFPHHAFPPP